MALVHPEKYPSESSKRDAGKIRAIESLADEIQSVTIISLTGVIRIEREMSENGAGHLYYLYICAIF